MIQFLGVARVRTLAAGAGMVALIGCGSDEASTKKATPVTTKAAAAAVPAELVGTWVAKLAPLSSAHLEGGKYTMKMRADGSVEMYYPSGNTADECLTQKPCQTITVKASAGKLTIIESDDCPAPAEYSYKLEADKFTTKRVQDACYGDRPRLYNGTTWRRQGP
jgi:hypothetical protein